VPVPTRDYLAFTVKAPWAYLDLQSF